MNETIDRTNINTEELAVSMMSNHFDRDDLTKQWWNDLVLASIDPVSIDDGKKVNSKKQPEKENWWDKYILCTSNQFKKGQRMTADTGHLLEISILNDPFKTEKNGISTLRVINRALLQRFGIRLVEQPREEKKTKEGTFYTYRYEMAMEPDKIMNKVPYIEYDGSNFIINDVRTYVADCNKCIKKICIDLSSTHMTPAYILKEKPDANNALPVQYPFGIPHISTKKEA